MPYPNKKVILSLVFIFCLAVLSPVWAASESTGVILADSKGKILYSQHQNVKLIPASILKILTSLTALDTLGANFRFKTLFAFNPATCDLYIKGLGDPMFISEAVRMMCRQILKDTGAKKLRHIILDNSFFDPDIRIPGAGSSLNPYDAVTGALCANFNTIAFMRDPQSRVFISAEPQTPLVEQFIPQTGMSGVNKGRIRLSRDQAKQYPGYLIKALFKEKGIQVTGKIKSGRYRTTGTTSGVFHSPFSLSHVVQNLLAYSNNFMANQLMLVLGAQDNKPARVETGAAALRTFAQNKLGTGPIDIVEGSGLSRQNRISPAQMLKILLAFKPYHDLMKANGTERYKTGTLNGIRTRAGYLRGSNRALYPFVIMVNQPGKGYSAIRKMLKKKVAAASM